MTLKDYIFECEHFEESKEYYEIVKESLELNMALLYLNSQSFTEDVYNEFEDYTFTEGYFMEADTVGQSLAFKNVKMKSDNLFKKIMNKLKTAMNVIITFFKNIINKIIKTEIDTKTINALKNVKVNSLSEDKKKQLKEAILNAWDDDINDYVKLHKDSNFNLQEIFNSIISNEITVYPSADKSRVNEHSVIAIEDWDKVVTSSSKIASVRNPSVFRKVITGINTGNVKKYINIDKIVIKFNKSDLESITSSLEKGRNVFNNALSKLGQLKDYGDNIFAGTSTALLGKLMHSNIKTLSSDQMISNLIDDISKENGNSFNPDFLTQKFKEYGNWRWNRTMGNIFMIIGIIHLFIGIRGMINNHYDDKLVYLYKVMNYIQKNILFVYSNIYKFRAKALTNIVRLKLV